MSVVHLEKVSRVYSLGAQDIQALKSVELEIQEQEFVSIVGKSGSGKSSLMNLVAGLDRPSQGKIKIVGQDLATLSRKELADYRAKRIGMIFQSFNLISQKTAFQNVELPLVFQGEGKTERRKRVQEILDSVGLKERMEHKPPQLSGGERQRVAIARALVSQPKLLLADEPTGNLDSQTSQEILSLFLRIYKEFKTTVLLITHDQEIAESVSTRIIEIRDGEILKDRCSTQDKKVLK